MIKIVLSERDFDYEIQALVNSFFPGQTSRIVVEGTDTAAGTEKLIVGVRMSQTEISVWYDFNGQRVEKSRQISGEQDFHKYEGKTAHPYRTKYKNQLKKLLFQLLSDIDRSKLPEEISLCIPVWGTMTGVRPAKIPMSELLAGKSREEIKKALLQEYQCTEQKAELCMEVARKEADLLQKTDYKNGYSLYIGIPFCPTTCMYCSFTSYPLSRFEHLIPTYLEALKKEIAYCGELYRGGKLSSIYIGGGTPTTLSAVQLKDLICWVKKYFPVKDAYEFTVEAGRPDSITREKLLVLKEAGVERISVNPQTMQDKTLKLIGRQHTVAQTKEVFQMAREVGFANINMDLIIGLPGESVEDFADTLCQVKQLNPDSLTIHSLVVKRASRLREIMDNCGEVLEVERAWKMEQMLALGEEYARENGYLPYYMYRQKNSAGYAGSSGQENIGFSREGKECLYNILIMEEKQTILAVGAGASTKRYDSVKNMVSRVENVKSVTDYIERIDEMLERKHFLKGDS